MIKNLFLALERKWILAEISWKKPYGATHFSYEPGKQPDYYRQSFMRLYVFSFDQMRWVRMEENDINYWHVKMRLVNPNAKVFRCLDF